MKYGYGPNNPDGLPNLENAPMDAFLQPSMFDWVVEEAILCGAGADENGVVAKPSELKSPSAALKVGFDIARMANNKMVMAIQTRDTTARSDAGDFLAIMRIKWLLKVTKYAKLALQNNNKTRVLPHPEDLKNFSCQV